MISSTVGRQSCRRFSSLGSNLRSTFGTLDAESSGSKRETNDGGNVTSWSHLRIQPTLSFRSQRPLYSQVNGLNLSSARYFSSDSGSSPSSPPGSVETFYTDEAAVSSASPESSSLIDSLSSILGSNPIPDLPESLETVAFDPIWYYPSDQCITLMNYIHATTGLNYASSIILTTIVIRVSLFPLMVKAQQNTSRMAHATPELNVLKSRFESAGKSITRDQQLKYSKQMSAVFKKYECNPFKAMLVPITQMPIFMGMFFGLRKMPELFPDELQGGGILWFPDLTMADPYYAMPVLSAMMFVATIELTKSTMMASNPAQGQLMVNVFRGMGILMVPLTMSFPAVVFTYWMTNNTISFFQTGFLQQPIVRKTFGILDPPKPVPGAPPTKGIMDSVKDMYSDREKTHTQENEGDRLKKHNQEVDKRSMNKKKTRRFRR